MLVEVRRGNDFVSKTEVYALLGWRKRVYYPTFEERPEVLEIVEGEEEDLRKINEKGYKAREVAWWKWLLIQHSIWLSSSER